MSIALLAILRAGDVEALGPLWVGGSFEAQQLVRTPDVDEMQFIQQRNTLRLIADWTLIDADADAPPGAADDAWLKRARLFLLYRGVYDSVYDYLPSVPTRKDYRGVVVPPPFDNLDDLDLSARDALKYENRIREAYLDVELAEGVLLRLGRQQVVWGASDGFRVLDRVNSLDLTWHQYQQLPPSDDSFDEIRVPAWMLLVRKNFIGVLDRWGSFAEVVWNPGDWSPNKVGFLPTPWGLQIVDPLIDQTTDQTFRLQNGTQLFRQGDYARDPGGNSQVGVRVGTDRQLCTDPTGCKLQGSLAYLYHRFTPWGGASTSAAPLFEVDDPVVAPDLLPFEFDAPYIHTLGLSLSWVPTLRGGLRYPIPTDETANDEVVGLFNRYFWEVGLRLESTLDLGVPFYACQGAWTNAPGPQRCLPPAGPAALPPTRRVDLWSGVLGADVLYSRRGRIVTSFQFFWTYVLNEPDDLVGSLDFPSFFAGAPGGGFRDDVRRWEALTTFTAARSFLGGRVRVSGIHLLDWVNSFSQEVAWAVEYRFTPDLRAELSQRLLINPKSGPNFEPWALAGLNRGRSEIGLRVRYDFPTWGF